MSTQKSSAKKTKTGTAARGSRKAAKPSTRRAAAKPRAQPADPLDQLDALREQILLATLPAVVFDGWTRRAMTEGAEAAGRDSTDLLRAFPDGPLEMLAYHSQWADRVMLADMEEAGVADMRVRDRITFAVRVRLERATPHKEAIRRGLSLLAQPQNAALGSRLLWRTVDAIWHGAGDTATDYNYYTKRALLSGVYSATLLFWLNDASEDHQDSWEFLDRRIADVMNVGKALGRLRPPEGALPARLPSPRLFFELLREGPLGRNPSGRLRDVPERDDPGEAPSDAPEESERTVH